MAEGEKIILPQKYYLDYFLDLIALVQNQYHAILSKEDFEFIEQFQSLSEGAQCLYVRFSNRRGPCYRLGKINYEEILNVKASAEELIAANFASKEIPNDFQAFNIFTKSELQAIFKDELDAPKSLGKNELIEQLLEMNNAHESLLSFEEIVQVEKQFEFEFFKLLYFGSYKAQMTEFVIRDVGHIKLERLDQNLLKPWCQSREEAIAFYEVSELKSSIRKALSLYQAQEIHNEIEGIDWDIFLRFNHSSKALGKIALELGQQLEREKCPHLALKYYQLTDTPPSKERQVRIHDALGEQAVAEELAKDLLVNYQNATEKIFAYDFLRRKNVRINRSMTSKLTGSPVIQLEVQPNVRVEQLVIDHFQTEGYQAIHSENYLWRNLFGLIFWNELFDQSQNDFHHPLQRVSSDLYQIDFLEKKESLIENKLSKLVSKGAIKAQIRSTVKAKEGTSQPFIYWYSNILYDLEALISKLKPMQIRKILLEMARNFKGNSVGFPDLFIWNDDQYFLYEIKSPNDHLSAQQLFWIEFMQELKVNVNILRVEYGSS